MKKAVLIVAIATIGISASADEFKVSLSKLQAQNHSEYNNDGYYFSNSHRLEDKPLLVGLEMTRDINSNFALNGKFLSSQERNFGTYLSFGAKAKIDNLAIGISYNQDTDYYLSGFKMANLGVEYHSSQVPSDLETRGLGASIAYDFGYFKTEFEAKEMKVRKIYDRDNREKNQKTFKISKNIYKGFDVFFAVNERVFTDGIRVSDTSPVDSGTEFGNNISYAKDLKIRQNEIGISYSF